MHVDDWLDQKATTEQERLAKEFLEHARRPAVEKDWRWLHGRIVSCIYGGERLRCTGASRLGDVWLSRNPEQKSGYTDRVDVMDCLDWEVTLAIEEGA